MGDYDVSRFALGFLCRKGHEYNSTGNSLRRLKKRRGQQVPGDCVQCQREDRKRRYAANSEQAKKDARGWYEKNQDRSRATRHSYYESHKDEISAYQALYRRENVEVVQETKHMYYMRNQDRIKEAATCWYVGHLEQAKDTRKKWRLTHLEEVRAWNRWYSCTPQGKERARRAQVKYRVRKQSQIGVVSLLYKEAFLEALDHRCACCGVELTVSSKLSPTSLTWDHVLPISRGGRDEDANLLPLCLSCNASKGNRTFVEWLQTPVWEIKDLRAVFGSIRTHV